MLRFGCVVTQNNATRITAPPITVFCAGVSSTINQTQNGANTISLRRSKLVRAAGT